MPTPAYITDLRRRYGQGLLLLPGVSAVVFDAEGRILLGQRTDSGRWSLPSGIVEPGEQPGTSMLRELMEETCVQARIDRLALLTAEPAMTYPNGDQCQFISMVFRCTYEAGEARVGDEESIAVGWFAVDALPELTKPSHRRIACALPQHGETILDW